jgi:hypothetical protein
VADERLTLRQAAARLGVSESAIRKRVERGTLRSDKGADGRRYVYLDTGADSVADTGADTSATHAAASPALISEMQDRIEFLQRELERKDAILLNMTEAMKAINPPRESPVSSDSPGPTRTPTSEAGEPETPTSRPWWRRIFEG